MNSGYTLRNHTLNPSGSRLTVDRRIESEIKELKAGDFVDLCIERTARDGTSLVLIEQVCVEIEETHPDYFDGVVHEETAFNAYHGIHAGDGLCFQRHHIFDIIFADAPDLDDRLDLASENVCVAREFLEELGPSELPHDFFTHCRLDDQINVQVRPGNRDLGVLAVVKTPAETLPGGLQIPSERFLAALLQAAKRLNFPARLGDLNGDTETQECVQFILGVPSTATGRELVATVLEKVQSVRGDAAQLLAAQAGTTTNTDSEAS